MLLAVCAPAFALDVGQLAPSATTTADAALSDPALDDAISTARASQLAWQAMRETPTAKASRERSRSQFQGLSDPDEWTTNANSPNPGNWGFHSGDFYGTYGLLIWPRYSTSYPGWYGLSESGSWWWQGAFFRNENVYRYYSGDTRGNGKNVLAIHGVMDPPNGRWITGVATVSGGTTGNYDTQSPWTPASTFGYHYDDDVDHCFIGESRNSCDLSALAEHHPDLTGRWPAMTGMWVDGTQYAEQGAVFMRYAYAYTVNDFQTPPVPTPPHDTRIDSGPPAATRSTSATFSFSAIGPTGGGPLPGTTFECQLDTGGWQNCPSPKTYSGLSDGSHVFQVRAKDVVGTTDPSPASHTWRVDTTPPETTMTSAPPSQTSQRDATLSFTANESPVSFECRLDPGGWQPCSSPRTYSSLANDTHWFEVRATDQVGNTDATPAFAYWLVAQDLQEDVVDGDREPYSYGDEPGEYIINWRCYAQFKDDWCTLKEWRQWYMYNQAKCCWAPEGAGVGHRERTLDVCEQTKTNYGPAIHVTAGECKDGVLAAMRSTEAIRTAALSFRK